jgi:ATP dependent DNA ligase domain
MPGAAMLSRLHPAGFVEPCLPTPARAVPTGPQWAHEIKHDGFRFIVRRDGDRVRVFSRHGMDWTDKVPAIVDAVLALPVKSATFDGEPGHRRGGILMRPGRRRAAYAGPPSGRVLRR